MSQPIGALSGSRPSASTPTAKAIGLGLVPLAFAVLVIDYFSAERAGIYHQHIVAYQRP